MDGWMMDGEQVINDNNRKHLLWISVLMGAWVHDTVVHNRKDEFQRDLISSFLYDQIFE
jgi:hypothetical protein